MTSTRTHRQVGEEPRGTGGGTSATAEGEGEQSNEEGLDKLEAGAAIKHIKGGIFLQPWQMFHGR